MSSIVSLVADVGEGFGTYRTGDDEGLIPYLTAANVACGFHAGDPHLMSRTVELCKRAGASLGAHPGFDDLRGFGRRHIELDETEIYVDMLYQIGALEGFARAGNLPMTHVAPHGRLGNLVRDRRDYARGVARAVAAFDPSLIVMGLGGYLETESAALGLTTATMVCVDRSYEADGSLTSRDRADSVLHDVAQVCERAVRVALEGKIVATDGTDIDVRADSLLVHGDNPAAGKLAKAVALGLDEAGVKLRTLPEVVAARQRERTLA